MNWIDSTSYSRDDKERIPTAWSLTLPSGLRITITKGHIYAKGKWVMHCFQLGIDTLPLNVPPQDIESAKYEAIMRCRKTVAEWHGELQELP